MPQYAPNNKYYAENQTIPTQLEYPILGAAGAGARARNRNSFYRTGNGSLEELLNATSSPGNIGTDASPSGDITASTTNPNQKNEILNIPSFLSYPSDLGINRRFHHFIMFNIYQGSSDEVRLKTRQANQIQSSLLAKGGLQFGSQSGGGGGNSETDRNYAYNSLIQAGFSQEQARRYSDAIIGGGGLGSLGLTSDERIGAVDNALQGALTNSVGEVDPDSGTLSYINPVDNSIRIANTAVGAAQFVYQAAKSGVNYFNSIVDETNSDALAEANANPRNFNQRGTGGRLANRPKSEQNILLANRRFTKANIKSKDTIALYMPQKITMNDQLVYSEEDMGTTKMILDALTGKRGAASALIEKIGRRTVSDAVAKIGEMANGVAAVGGALNEVAQETNLAAVRAAQTRTVANPRKQMMFRDVGVRSHSFSFDFMPKNEKEAETVLNIIRMLRYHAYPGLQGGGGHFFTFPAEFELTFYTIEEPSGMVVINDNLPKLPKLALQSVNVDFSAAGDFKTFTDAKPAFIRLELGFQEMEQLTNEHIVHGY